MPNRRDQYQGYRFVIRRRSGALLRADLDSADSPLRRLSNGTAASVVTAVLAMVGAGLWGLISPSGGSSSWQSGKTLIVDGTTGTRYVYLGGQLHPVLNYSSALLILKAGAVSATRVSDRAVSSAQHGAPVGIAGAPDAVPSAGSLLSGPWTVCSTPAITTSGTEYPRVRLSLGSAPATTALPSASALLVEGVSGSLFLIWNGTRLALSNAYAQGALGYGAATPITVGDAWLNAVPRGPDLTAILPAGLGEAVPGLAGAKVGQVFQATGTGTFYLAYPDGLAAITPLEQKLLLADPRIAQGAYGGDTPHPVPVAPAQALAVQASEHPARQAGLPAAVPVLQTPDGAATRLCAGVADAGQGTMTIGTGPASQQTLNTANPAEASDASGNPIADAVDVPDGKGALVRAVPAPGVSSGAVYLVSDTGIKYRVTESSVLNDLGLSGATPTALPQVLVQLLPTGPSLDEAAALAEQAP